MHGKAMNLCSSHGKKCPKYDKLALKRFPLPAWRRRQPDVACYVSGEIKSQMQQPHTPRSLSEPEENAVAEPFWNKPSAAEFGLWASKHLRKQALTNFIGAPRESLLDIPKVPTLNT